MKYHLQTPDSKDSLCGLKDHPARWIFDYSEFTNHYAPKMACKKCSAMLDTEKQKLEFVVTVSGIDENWIHSKHNTEEKAEEGRRTAKAMMPGAIIDIHKEV